MGSPGLREWVGNLWQSHPFQTGEGASLRTSGYFYIKPDNLFHRFEKDALGAGVRDRSVRLLPHHGGRLAEKDARKNPIVPKSLPVISGARARVTQGEGHAAFRQVEPTAVGYRQFGARKGHVKVLSACQSVQDACRLLRLKWDAAHRIHGASS